MTFVIGAKCIDVMDRSCVDVCPVDCIYEGERKLYIQPDECIECGACEPACPTSAIAFDEALTDEMVPHAADNRVFFELVLPGQDAALGSPGGARHLGPLPADTPLVAAHPVAEVDQA